METEIQKYGLADPKSTLALATELNQFITNQQLSIDLQGRKYVKVEGWQYAGSQLGIIPVITAVCNESNESECKYRATVELQSVHSGKKLGYGVAICSNLEPGKQKFAEYAIASMSQTRAIGKAYRLLLAWLIKAAGYEPTPAEEMDAVHVEQIPEDQSQGKYFNIPVRVMTDKQRGCIDSLLKNPAIPEAMVLMVKSHLDNFTLTKASKCIEYLQSVIKNNN